MLHKIKGLMIKWLSFLVMKVLGWIVNWYLVGWEREKKRKEPCCNIYIVSFNYAKGGLIGWNIYCWKTKMHHGYMKGAWSWSLSRIKSFKATRLKPALVSYESRQRQGLDVRWDAGSRQHFGLHGVEALALTDAQLDLHSVMGVVLEEEAVVDDKLGIGSCAVEYVDLQEE